MLLLFCTFLMDSFNEKVVELEFSFPLWHDSSLCWLRLLPLVWSIDKVDVHRLENEFIIGYCDGDWVLYVSMYNDKTESLDISSNISNSWTSLRWSANDRFEAELALNPDLVIFASKMFYVWVGNHRLTAWWRHINNFHDNDKIWHMSVHLIVLDP